MPRITFISASGMAVSCAATPGRSIMQIATEAHIQGIVGECGGAMMCATCHVYVPDESTHLFPSADATELDMLDLAIAEITPQSRLSCQLAVRADMPDFSIRLPDRQT